MKPFAYVRSGSVADRRVCHWRGARVRVLRAAVGLVCAASWRCCAHGSGLLLIESAIIMPAYRPHYHGYLMLFFPLVSIFAAARGDAP